VSNPDRSLPMHRGNTFLSVVVAGLFCLFGVVLSSSAASPVVNEVPRSIFEAGYPRLIYFRNIEAAAVEGVSQVETWAKLRMHNGLVAKAFNEEKFGLADYALPYLRALRQRQPEYFQLLHYNGKSRDPRDMPKPMFPGHFLHRVGSIIETDLPAESGLIELTVRDPARFSMTVGKKTRYPDDLTLVEVDDEGLPNWRRWEQMQLVALDVENSRLTVRRAAFDSHAQAWPAGRSYLAPLAADGAFPPQGPHEEQNLWRINFRPDAPRDPQGRSAVDVLVDDLARRLLPGGAGDFFDGVTFDVMPYALLNDVLDGTDQTKSGFFARFGYAMDSVDSDGDGKADDGFRDGVNQFGLGVMQFQCRLRERLGEHKIIMIDSNRRANSWLNGVESEGWPSYEDIELNHWSSGIDEHRYWRRFGREPRLTYVHRYGMPPLLGSATGRGRDYPRARLIMVAAQFMGAALVTQHNPQPEGDEVQGMYDELKAGMESRINWLGQPLDVAQHLALATPNIWRHRNFPDWLQEDAVDFDGNVESTESGLAIRGNSPEDQRVRLRWQAGEIPSTELLVRLHVRAQPPNGMPTGVARRIRLRVVSETGSEPAVANEQWCWANEDAFEMRAYFRGLKPGVLTLEIEARGGGEVELLSLEAYGAPNPMYREFEHGLVLANPGLDEVEIDLRELLPGQRFRRLSGSLAQDPVTNNGELVSAQVVLPARDGLFLHRVKNAQGLTAQRKTRLHEQP
jgi:hypothetical protein